MGDNYSGKIFALIMGVPLLFFLGIVFISNQPTSLQSTEIQANKGVSRSQSWTGTDYYVNTDNGSVHVSGSNFNKQPTNNRKLKNKVKIQEYKGNFIPTNSTTVVQYDYSK